MMLDKSVQEFLEKYIHKIEINDWDWIYFQGMSELIQESQNPYIQGYFSAEMEDSEIYPLNYLVYVPNGYMTGTGIRHYDIPDHVRSIEAYAFSDCSSLETVRLPKNLEKVGKSVFNGCDSLRLLKYPGTIEDFGKIIFISDNSPLGLSRKIKVQCSDGEIEV